MAVWEGLQRERRLQRTRARGRPHLAAGLDAAGLREVHAPGRYAVRAGLHRGRAAQQRRHHPLPRPAVRGAVRPGRPSGRAHRRHPRGAARRGRRSAPTSRSGSCAPSTTSRSLDHDRILRSYLTIIHATLRTNFFQHRRRRAAAKTYLSLKLEPTAIPDLPEPRPAFEIFVYSPRVEGVHLRFGAVARGGPALVRPPRRLPHRGARPGQGADGEEHRDRAGGRQGRLLLQAAARDPAGPTARPGWPRAIACYKTFISGLLDITDNLVEPTGARSCRRGSVVRHDGDDPYLVVAADKGTATFSDIANGVAQDYGFWLGDAFASGGSVGYDHKAMGITARGAWESVRRHFREMGRRLPDRGLHLRRHR